MAVRPTAVPRVGFVSLGCPKALVDSERILTQLRAEGYDISADYDGADLVVVNTCGFIDSAVAESLDGRSLVPQIGDPAAASDGMAAGFWQRAATLRTDTHRLIVSGKDRATVELYDHREDPAEAVNVAGKQKEEAAALRSRLEKLVPGS